MSNIAIQRIKREFKEVISSEEIQRCSIKLELVNDSWTSLRGEICGPPETPYEGGTFKLDILIPDTYPFVPPKMRFITKIWHPNISSATGAVCLDILKDQWAAAMTLRTALLSIQALLAAPEPDDPQDAVVAMQFKKSGEIYKSTAAHWTAVYANGPYKNSEYDAKVANLIELGIEETEARTTLSAYNWNLQQATSNIFF